MPLIHPKILSRRVATDQPIPESHAETLRRWSVELARGTFNRETSHDSEFIQRILIEVLGFIGSSEGGGEWTVAKNHPVGRGNVDVALGSFGPSHEKIVGVLELKGARTRDLDAVMPGRNKTPVQQAWEYAVDTRGVSWILVSNYRELRIYAMGWGRSAFERHDFSTAPTRETYWRLQKVFSAKALLGGGTQSLLDASAEKGKDITKALYQEYSSLRSKLIAELVQPEDAVSPELAVRFAQTILDRALFIIFTENRGLLPEQTLKTAVTQRNAFNPQPLWDNLRGLFRAVDEGNSTLGIPGYNGGLFAPNADIDHLTLSDDSCLELLKLAAYDYTDDVDVDVLGHIFEQSVQDIEEIKARLRSSDDEGEAKGRRRREGIFYTPATVTSQMVESVVGEWLRRRREELGFQELPELTEQDYESIRRIKSGKSRGRITANRKVQRHITAWRAYEKALAEVRVLDPACGSGAFLNAVFDYLYREGESINSELTTLFGGQTHLYRWDAHLLTNNLFGVDINSESVEITKLSLWLKTANREEKLTFLDKNILQRNSLDDRNEVVGHLAIDWAQAFPDGFDIVIANPPYVDSEEMSSSGQTSFRKFLSDRFDFTQGNWDLYIAFLELGFRLLRPDGLQCFITPDKWLSKPFGEAARRGLLPHLTSMLRLGPDQFESVRVDAVVTTYSQREGDTLDVLEWNSGAVVPVRSHGKSELAPGAPLDFLFSSRLSALEEIESAAGTLGDIALCESACATRDCYDLKPLIADSIDKTAYRVVNTGTLSPYVFRWGRHPMRYLKDDYQYPTVDKTRFESEFGDAYVRKSQSKKLIIKGITLLDGALDLEAKYIPGKSTLAICHDDESTLKIVAAVINSAVASFYIKEKYASASYNGGVVFTKDMLNALPVPKLGDTAKLESNVDDLVVKSEELGRQTHDFLRLMAAELGLEKIGRKLSSWPRLDDVGFVDELKKRIKGNRKLSLSARSEWLLLFQTRRTAADRLIREIEALQKENDEFLATAYGLSESARRAVEQASKGAE